MLLKHCSAAMVAAALILVASPVRAQEAHGAIAFGQTAYGESVAYGFAWNYGAKGEAIQAALSACLAGGGTNCEELAWFRNGCGALALDRFGHHDGTGAMSQDQAEARAVRSCEAAGGSGCAVVGSQCASPGGQAGTWSGSERVLAPPEAETAEPEAKAESEAESQQPATEAQEPTLTREQRIRVQRGLAALGFDAGPADGIFGPRTRAAIRDWQAAKGLETTGYLTTPEAEALAAVGAGADSGPSASKPQNRIVYFRHPTCGTDEAPDGCWRELSSPARCDVWVASYSPSDHRYAMDETVTWSGDCRDSLAYGRGTLRGTRKGKDWSDTGELVEGKRHGHWVERRANGTVSEGPYVDGERHGRWVIRLASGSVHEGPYVDGEEHGRWVMRFADGGVWEGPYVDGKRHGRWVTRYAHGTTEVEEYRNGELVP